MNWFNQFIFMTMLIVSIFEYVTQANSQKINAIHSRKIGSVILLIRNYETGALSERNIAAI